MKIYLAGGITGNLNKLWKEMSKIYLAGTLSRPFVIEEAMKLYLADLTPFGRNTYSNIIENNKPYILESYYYIKDQNDWIIKMRPFFKDFLLDSGAFSFFGGKSKNINWIEYTKNYAEFIKKHDINNFIELDIEKITNLNLVEDLRKLLQDKTGKNPIPVWRPYRKIDYWYNMVENFNYIAISASGQYDSAWTREKNAPIVLNTLLNIAKKKNVKVHGLGYTDLKNLPKIPFYSVDSTAWLYGNRGGFLYHFNGKSIDKIKPKGMRLKGREAAIHNFSEWLKYSKYAENNL